MKFSDIKLDLAVIIRREKIRGIVRELQAADEHVAVQIDEMGSRPWFPAKDLDPVPETPTPAILIRPFPNGSFVETPKGRGVVVDHDNPVKRLVAFYDREAGFHHESFSIDQLREAAKPDAEAARKHFEKLLNDEVAKQTDTWALVKKVLKSESGGT